MKLTMSLIESLTGGSMSMAQSRNAAQLVNGVAIHSAGLNHPQNLVPFLANVMHESQDFRYDRELWGPTEAQKRYDTRTDIGNTPQVDGDGYANRGMGSMQITGAYNRQQFRLWLTAVAAFENVPDFVGNENLLGDPWEGLSAVWYWDAGNPTRGSLNKYADEGNFQMVCQRINGALNGYQDRCQRYGTIATKLLGYSSIKDYQIKRNLTVDGIVGPKTLAVMHKDLVRLDYDEQAVPVEPVTLEQRVAALEAQMERLRAFFPNTLGS